MTTKRSMRVNAGTPSSVASAMMWIKTLSVKRTVVAIFPASVVLVLGNLRFLLRTDAPATVIFRYLATVVIGGRDLAPYREPQRAFREQMHSLRLSNDWFTWHIPYWLSVFDEYSLPSRARLEACEIGSWEGLSSYFILKSLPNAALICVDSWEGADEHKSGYAATEQVLSNIESSFDANLAPFESRLTKYRGTSFSFFNENRRKSEFDLIYVDGSHHCDDVVVDAVKCFQMLKVGGLMIFDDYLWRWYPRAMDNPAAAIHAFLRLKKGSCKIVRVYEQLIIEKTRDPSSAR
jgi:predicted O-methyltransferase YrrM